MKFGSDYIHCNEVVQIRPMDVKENNFLIYILILSCLLA